MNVIINLTAVLAAAVSSMLIGSLWYGQLFRKPWEKLAGFTPEQKAAALKKGMGKSYAMAFVGAFVMAYVFAHFAFFVGAITVADGLELGFWVWLGFAANIVLGQVLWLGKSWTLYAIDAGYYLAVLLVMGMILAVWK